jgi:hypothetical protein
LVVFAALGIAAAPFAFALADTPNDGPNEELVTVSGEVTAFFYKGCKDPENGTRLATAFVIDDDIVVTFGPWWYWMHVGINMTDFLEVGDDVRVTGEWEEREDGAEVLCAWHMDNLTTDEELTIKEEGRPPWAGGPKALGIHPWPSSLVDE